MKLLTIISFVLLIAIRSFAQENPDKSTDLRKVEKYRKMKNGGAVLTVVGGVLAVTGAAIALDELNSGVTNIWSTSANTEPENPHAGEAVFLVGGAFLASGIPLWIVGERNQRKYNKKLGSVSVRLGVNTQRPGLALTCRF